MNFTFLKRKKKNNEIKFLAAMLEEGRDDLLKQLFDIKLSKNEMIENFTREIVHLKEMNKLNESIIDSQESINEICKAENKELHNVNKKLHNEIQILNDKIFELKLMIPGQFPLSEIMNQCADAAWYGKKEDIHRVFESLDGKIKLFFCGKVYEPSYESFTSGCCVYYLEKGMDKKKPLYTVDDRCVEAYRKEVIKFGSVEDVKQYLVSKNIGFKVA